MLSLFGCLCSFIKDFVKTLIIDTLVGFCLRPIGL